MQTCGDPPSRTASGSARLGCRFIQFKLDKPFVVLLGDLVSDMGNHVLTHKHPAAPQLASLERAAVNQFLDGSRVDFQYVRRLFKIAGW